jgi:hypothetical protein
MAVKRFMARIRNALWLLLLAAIFAEPGAGQSVQNSPSNSAPDNTTAPVHAGILSRWLDLQTGNSGARYKKAKPSNGPWFYQFQYQFMARGRILFDREGRYHAGFRLSTGDIFPYAWNATGIGSGTPSAKIYLKDLFLSATPRKLFEVQVGGIAINRGESTEITSYSNNGYMVGERISVRHPEKFFFDEISATGAYLEDAEKPGLAGRIHHLADMNYHQFLVSKKIHKRASVSADYTFQDGIDTLRQAIKLYPKRNRFVDSLVFENYQRLEFHPAWGFAVSVQKNPTPRLTLTLAYVDIDQYYLDWNADRLGKGKRIFVAASYNFWREFSAGVFANKAFWNSFPVNNASRFDLIVAYDFLKALKRAHIL